MLLKIIIPSYEKNYESILILVGLNAFLKSE